jgi:hypothetical protein
LRSIAGSPRRDRSVDVGKLFGVIRFDIVTTLRTTAGTAKSVKRRSVKQIRAAIPASFATDDFAATPPP